MTVTVRDIKSIPVDNSSIYWAAYTAAKKFPHTHRGTRERTDLEIIDNLFRGDLAKSCVIDYLMQNGVSISQEYDRVRTDNFRYAKRVGWDFITANNVKVEMNSSLMPYGYNTPTAIINGLGNREPLDIKVTARDNTNQEYKLPTNLDFDIAVQVYFSYVSKAIGNLSQAQRERIDNINRPDDHEGLNLILDLLDVYRRYRNSLHGYAWVSTAQMENIRQQNEASGKPLIYSKPYNRREYWYCKINECNPFDTLVHHT